MKKQILISLILVSSAISLNAQIYTPSGAIQGTSSNNNVGIGLTNPSQKLTVSGGSISVANYGNWIGIASPGSGVKSYARLLGTDIANSVDRASLTTNGYVCTNDNALVQDNVSLPTWALTLDANNDALYIKRASSGSTTAGALTTFLTVNNSGHLGIKTTNPQYELDVCGTIRAKEVKVDLPGGCDFVFRPDYKLMDLKTLEQFVKTNQHLPEIASEKEMVDNGINMKEMQMKLLQKMEEMTLYIIEQNKKSEQQSVKIEQQNQEMKVMKEKIEKIETASK